MRKFSGKGALFVIVCFVLSGCTGLVSPYSSKLQCPNTYKGKCVSVETAYSESINNPLIKQESTVKQENSQESSEKGDPADTKEKEKTPRYVYEEALYKKLASLIEKPSTPIVVPPQVMRVLILSYTGSENELFSYRYVYFFATEPKWIISTGKEVR